MIQPRILLAVMFFAGNFFALGDDAAPLPVEISPADPAIGYSGRFDMRDETAPRCEWPASTVTIKFTGTALTAKFSDSGQNFWQVGIDGKPSEKIALQNGAHGYGIVSGLAEGEHTVTLTKATEGFAGLTQFLGFQLDKGAKILPLPPVSRRIEVIGDSISCGYGVEAASQHEHFAPRTENASIAYGALAAAKLGAAYTCIAYSGRKMWPDNTIPEIYGRTLTNDASLKWDFPAPPPDVVVINLGTNDFAHENPDETSWAAAYKDFIARVRKNYPQAAIYCATGPMLSDDAPRKPKSTLEDYIKKIVAAENASGDTNIRQLDFAQQDPKDGFGADWHPSRKTQEIMSAKLIETLQRDLGWK